RRHAKRTELETLSWLLLHRAWSRHCAARREPRGAPCFIGQDIVQDRGRAEHISITQVERREAKAHVVRLAKIADHAALDQSLHPLVAMWMAKRHLAAALRVITRCRQRHAEAAAGLLDQRNEEIREREALRPHLLQVDVVPDIERALKRTHRQDRLGAA